MDRSKLVQEEPVDADRAIIDAHHHLWPEGKGSGGGGAYLHSDFLADMAAHNVVGSVVVESGASHGDRDAARAQSLQDTAFAAQQAADSALTKAPILGIVSFADLSQGDHVQDVLDELIAQSNGLFRGVRQHCGRDPAMPGSGPAMNLLADPKFRDGVLRLGRSGHVFDAFIFYRQLHELGQLIRSVPDTTFVLNHFGVPLNRGTYGSREDVMRIWRDGMFGLSRYDNVFVKIGGIGMDSLFGMAWSKSELPTTSDDVVSWWGDDLNWCIDAFSPGRCMFESNFPIDRRCLSYTILWNAFQKMAGRYSETEQNALFSATARRVYRLGDSALHRDHD